MNLRGSACREFVSPIGDSAGCGRLPFIRWEFVCGRRHAVLSTFVDKMCGPWATPTQRWLRAPDDRSRAFCLPW